MRTYLQLSLVSIDKLPLMRCMFLSLLLQAGLMLGKDLGHVFLVVGSQLGQTGLCRVTGLPYL
ncbi:hypothetical protein DPMN_018755 [Dreissena polymorpha]|uniref:Uncharacterized protein n=1 Tax=Dreissena polymorpha TaxID=45954 RepID=A0A9D4S8N4_DREPO|nr:hypothetical protein DPMN_018755 [Dreissena polymorpha]